MVKVQKRKGESDEALIQRFRKLTLPIIKSAKENKYHHTDAEKRAERKKRLKYMHQMKSEENE